MTDKKSRLVRVYKCDACGKEDVWSKEWRQYGSLFSCEDGNYFQFCSADCASTMTTEEMDKIIKERARALPGRKKRTVG